MTDQAFVFRPTAWLVAAAVVLAGGAYAGIRWLVDGDPGEAPAAPVAMETEQPPESKDDAPPDVIPPDVPLITPGTLTVCAIDPWKPFTYRDGDAFVGLSISVAEAVADDLGVSLSVVETSWDSAAFPEEVLDADMCDLQVSPLWIDEELEARIDLSDPYFSEDYGVLVRVGSGLGSPESLEGLSVATCCRIPETGWTPPAETVVVEYATFSDALAGFLSGSEDALVMSVTRLDPLVDASFEIGATMPSEGRFAFGARTGNAGLLDAVDATLARMVSDGSLDAIYDQFVHTPPAIR